MKCLESNKEAGLSVTVKMDLYKAIKPAYYFWKYTGVIAMTYKTDQGFAVLKSDEYLTLGLFFLLLVFVAANFLIFGNSDITSSGVVNAIYLSSITITSIVNFVILYIQSKPIVNAMIKLNLIDVSLAKGSTDMEIPYSKTRKSIIASLIAYFVVYITLVLLDLYSIFRYYFSISEFCYLLYYYIFGILNMSTTILILFFLKEISRRFRAINTKFGLKPERFVKDVKGLLQIHRQLRELGKNVNKIFQGILLGKVVSSSSVNVYVLFNYFAHWNNVVASKGYGAIVSGVWGAGRIFEIVAIVHYFSSVHNEVSRMLSIYLINITICLRYSFVLK